MVTIDSLCILLVGYTGLVCTITEVSLDNPILNLRISKHKEQINLRPL